MRCTQAIQAELHHGKAIKMEKIIIHVIDGSDMWLVVNAEQIEGDKYLIRDFFEEEFDADDTSILPQFIPGDLVITELKQNENGKQFRIAKTLIGPSKHEEKTYFELLYKLVMGNRPKDKLERTNYKDSIARVRKELKDGKFHYPAVENYVNGIGNG